MRLIVLVMLGLVAIASPLAEVDHAEAFTQPVTAHYSGWIFSYLTLSCLSHVDGAQSPTTNSWAFTIALDNCPGTLARIDYCPMATGSVRDGFVSSTPCASGATLRIQGTHVPREGGNFVTIYQHSNMRWWYAGYEFQGEVTGIALPE